MAKEFGDRVQFLECAISASNGADVPGFVSQFQPPFPVGFNDEAAVHKYLEWSFAQILYVPHIVILDAKGVIRGDYAGESDFVKNAAENISKELNKLLGASTASPKTAKKKK